MKIINVGPPLRALRGHRSLADSNHSSFKWQVGWVKLGPGHEVLYISLFRISSTGWCLMEKLSAKSGGGEGGEIL